MILSKTTPGIILKNTNWKDAGHAALDIAGFVPVIGAAADLTNAAWYAAEGDYANAALSGISAIPGLGDAVGAAAKGGKLIAKVTKGNKLLTGAGKLLPNAGKLGDLAKLTKKLPNLTKKIPGKLGELVGKIPLPNKVKHLVKNDVRYMKNRPVKPIEKTLELALNQNAYVEKVVKKYGINLRGTNGKIIVKIDEKISAQGLTRYGEKGEIIRISQDLLRSGDEAQIANTIAHELSHARDFQRSHKAGIKTLAEAEAKGFEKVHGDYSSVNDGSVYGAGNALEEYIKGNR